MAASEVSIDPPGGLLLFILLVTLLVMVRNCWLGINTAVAWYTSGKR